MLRLFVALDLPPDIARRLIMMQGGIPGARWQEEQNLHLTLRFIGEVDEGTAEDIDAALENVTAAPFSLTLTGTDVFAKGNKAHTLWAGVEKSDALNALKTRIDSGLQRAGIEAETRKFTPHVTIARLKDNPGAKLGEFLTQNNLFHAGPFDVRSFCLYQSHQTSHGTQYDILKNYSLRT